MPCLRPVWLLATLWCAACGPKTVFTDTDVPKLEQLEDVMWAQAQSADPQFKKIGAASYTDGDFAAFGATAARIQLTTAKLKAAPFSKGPAFNALAEKLAGHADELAQAAGAKDAARSSSALQAMKDTCKSCHKQFK